MSDQLPQKDHDLLVRIHESINGKGGIQERLGTIVADNAQTRAVAYKAQNMAKAAENSVNDIEREISEAAGEPCDLARENQRRLDKTQVGGSILGAIMSIGAAAIGWFRPGA